MPLPMKTGNVLQRSLVPATGEQYIFDGLSNWSQNDFSNNHEPVQHFQNHLQN